MYFVKPSLSKLDMTAVSYTHLDVYKRQGLHHVDAFPIDTHVKQLLDKYYSDGFDFERYKGVAGIIQQYFFYFEL